MELPQQMRTVEAIGSASADLKALAKKFNQEERSAAVKKMAGQRG